MSTNLPCYKDSRNVYFMYLLPFLLSTVFYAQTLSYDFVWDDQIVITQNKVTVQGIEGLAEIWSSFAYLEGRSIYRPVPQSIQAFVWGLFENSSLAFHLLNLFTYVLCCLVILKTLFTLFKNHPPWMLTLIAVLFTLLPVHTEVVANIKSFDELLSLLLVLSCFLLVLKDNPLLKILGVLLFILACLSKISAITTLPFLLYLLFFRQLASFWLKYKSKFFTADWCAIISVMLLLSSLMFEFYFIKKLYVIWLFFTAIPFVLFIRSRQLRFVLFLVITALFSYYLRWDYTLLFFILVFYLELKENRAKPLELIIKFVLYAGVTIALDYNSIIASAAFAFLFSFYYFYHKSNVLFKKYAVHFLTLLCVYALIISVTNEYFTFKPQILILAFLSILVTVRDRYPFRYKLVVLLLAFPLTEYIYFENDYEAIVANNQIVKSEVGPIEKTNEGLENLYPYHNILIQVKDPFILTATIARIQLIYLQKLIFPTALVHQHGTWQVKLASWKDWDVYLSILIHILLLWLAYYFYKLKYYITMWGVVWYFCTISICTNIVRLMPDTLAERWLFLPSIGFCAALVSALFHVIQKWKGNEKKALITLGLVLLPLMSYYAYKTIDRNKDWKNNYTLAANTLPYAQYNAAINAQYALELNNMVKNGEVANVDSATYLVEKHYKKAITLFPDFYGPNADLANYYILNANPDSAFTYLLEATRLKPNEWIHHYYLGLIFYERNNYSEALTYFDKIILNETLLAKSREFPELLEAYEFAARCSHNSGKDNEAYIYLERGIEVFNAKSTYLLLGNLYRVTGKKSLAIETFKKLQTLYPADQELVNTIKYLEDGLIY